MSPEDKRLGVFCFLKYTNMKVRSTQHTEDYYPELSPFERFLSVKVDQWFKDNRSLNLNKFAIWLPANVEEYWNRKHFKDFNYLQIEITQSQYNVIFFVIFFACILQVFITKRIFYLIN